MSRAISPHTMIHEQHHTEHLTASFETPSSKRTKRGCLSPASQHDNDEDDVAALLLTLGSSNKRAALDSRSKKNHEVKADSDRSHRVVSDDEDDDHQGSRAGSKKRKLQIAPSSQCSPPSKNIVDWRLFSRPIGPPPRLPMVPAGYVFPPAKTQNALNK